MMGKHKEWRKTAKKERRRRVRTQKARTRENLDVSSEEYKMWLSEQQSLEQFEIEQIEILNMEENEKWIQAEKLAMEQWNLLQNKKKHLLEEYLKQEAKLKLEWEREKQRKTEEEKLIKKLEEEKKKKHDVFMSQLEQFLSGDCIEPPAEFLTSYETRPQMELCPFFSKTASCRFGDQCSRNHRYPGISKVLLASNFYVHFGLNNANFSEYDTDVMLEYEDSDTYKEFIDFFNDVLPEFEKFGKIIQFKVCNNYEKHLRGNTYVEFAELRCAVAAYQALHSRWYGGRQLSLQFCQIDSWRNAICGLASRRRCPKGRACNFLHVFKNPNRLFHTSKPELHRNLSTPSRYWRWSESPERDIKSRKSNSRSHVKETREKEKSNARYKERRTGYRSGRASSSPIKKKKNPLKCK